jgi:hypothetical protein
MNVTVFNYDSSAVTFQVLDPGVRKYLQYIDGFARGSSMTMSAGLRL